MNSKGPQDSDKYEWTEHSKYKMRQYGLSAQRVLRVIRSPKRIEEGIVEKTIAVMQPASTRVVRSSTRLDSARLARGGPAGNISKKDSSKLQSAFAKASARQLSPKGESWSQEIWVMYQLRQSVGANSKLKIPKSKQIQNSKFKILNSANRKIRIISAWRFPGVSDESSPIPDDIMREIEEII